MRWNWNILYKSFSRDLAFWLCSIDTKHVYVCCSLSLILDFICCLPFHPCATFNCTRSRKTWCQKIANLCIVYSFSLHTHAMWIRTQTNKSGSWNRSSESADKRAREQEINYHLFSIVGSCSYAEEPSLYLYISLPSTHSLTTVSMSFIDKFSFCLFRFRLFYI